MGSQSRTQLSDFLFHLVFLHVIIIFIIFQWFLLYYILFFNVSHFSSYCEGNGLITEGEVYFNDFLILGGGG